LKEIESFFFPLKPEDFGLFVGRCFDDFSRYSLDIRMKLSEMLRFSVQNCSLIENQRDDLVALIFEVLNGM